MHNPGLLQGSCGHGMVDGCMSVSLYVLRAWRSSCRSLHLHLYSAQWTDRPWTRAACRLFGPRDVRRRRSTLPVLELSSSRRLVVSSSTEAALSLSGSSSSFVQRSARPEPQRRDSHGAKRAGDECQVRGSLTEILLVAGGENHATTGFDATSCQKKKKKKDKQESWDPVAEKCSMPCRPSPALDTLVPWRG